MKANTTIRMASIGCWLARALVTSVFLLWGAFFVEHAQAWFIAPFPQLPPTTVCIGQALHVLLLMGLLVSLRWSRVGGVWVTVVAFAFFCGRAGAHFPVFFALTVLPVALLWLCEELRRRRAVRTAAQSGPANP